MIVIWKVGLGRQVYFRKLDLGAGLGETKPAFRIVSVTGGVKVEKTRSV